MDNLDYTEIKMQDYLKSENIKIQDALNLFKFRTRMAEFGQNFRAGADEVWCPLCSEKLDDQSHSFQCKIIIKEIELKGNLSEIYSGDISQATAQTATKIINIRKKLIQKEDI